MLGIGGVAGIVSGSRPTRVASANATECTLSVAIPIRNASASHAVGMVSTLLAWCADDATCAAQYRLNPRRPNLGAFRHLLSGDLEALSLADPLYDLVCGSGGDTTEALRRVWLPLLVAYRKTQSPLCDVDHELYFDPDTRQQECICLPNRPCRRATNDPVPLYVVYSLLAVIAVVLLIASILRTVTLLRTLNKVTGDERAGLRALFGAAKG